MIEKRVRVSVRKLPGLDRRSCSPEGGQHRRCAGGYMTNVSDVTKEKKKETSLSV